MRGTRRALLWGLLFALSALPASAEPTARLLPPDPYWLLQLDLSTPPIDAVATCLAPADSEGDAADAVVSEIRAARSTTDASSIEQARRGLAAALAALVDSAASPSRACGWLELARLHYLEGRAPDAAVSARRARRLSGGDEASSAVRRAALFYRAEARARSGAAAEAEELFQELAGGETPVARAARLRLAELLQSREPGSENRRALEQRIEEARGTRPADWAPRIAEWALAEGDLEAAERWLATPGEDFHDDELAGAVEIRRADLLAVRGDPDGAVQRLRELAESGRTESLRRVAQVRALDWMPRPSESALRRLERSAASETPRLRSYARWVLARHALDRERFDLALELLVRLAHDGVHAPPKDRLMGLFDRAIAGLSATRSCDAWVATAGGRRDLLLRHTTVPGPFLRLGDCYLELGMPSAALDTYRGAAKSFGPSVVAELTLRSARAEHLLGRVPSARAVARASVKAGREPQHGWRLLLAEILLALDRAEEAVDLLRPLLGSRKEAPDAPLPSSRVIWVAARAAVRAPDDAETAGRLRDLIARVLAPGKRGGLLAESSLLVADLHRRAGEARAAHALYGLAFETLDPGSLRSRAGYWQGALASHPEGAREAWSRVAGDGDPWARLASNEIALADGRVAVGAGEALPSSRRGDSTPGASR